MRQPAKAEIQGWHRHGFALPISNRHRMKYPAAIGAGINSHRTILACREHVPTFEGIGDASPENVPPHILPHLNRMAETRAKARALRDAVKIGVVSFEELDGDGLALDEPDLGPGATQEELATNGRENRQDGKTA